MTILSFSEFWQYLYQYLPYLACSTFFTATFLSLSTLLRCLQAIPYDVLHALRRRLEVWLLLIADSIRLSINQSVGFSNYLYLSSALIRFSPIPRRRRHLFKRYCLSPASVTRSHYVRCELHGS